MDATHGGIVVSKLSQLALKDGSKYRTKKTDMSWFGRLQAKKPKLAQDILDLVEEWKHDKELQRAYPSKHALSKFIADLPGISASHEVIRKQKFFEGISSWADA